MLCPADDHSSAANGNPISLYSRFATRLQVMSESNLPHVLAVDDDPVIRNLISEYLTDNDVRVTVAADGKEMTASMRTEW
jgi:PleD family two-component response regulator